jgi:hypothetical protein
MTDTQKITTLRPSSLPKLAQCPGYTNSPFKAGPPAMRGTITDEGYRDYFAIGEDAPNFVNMDERIAELSGECGVELAPAKAGVQWAIDYTKLLAKGSEIITDEDRLTVKTPMLDSSSGTMDCHIPQQRIIIDLKSGMVRNYKEQLAAYAMEVMNDRFEEKYEAYLLFLDSQTVVKYIFTFEEAQGIVAAIRMATLDPYKQLKVNQYCGWCGSKDTCQERISMAARSMAALDTAERFDAILDDPIELADFLTGVEALDDLYKRAKAKGVDYISEGVEVPGYKMVARKGNETLPNEQLSEFITANNIQPHDVASLAGNPSKSKFLKFAAEVTGDDPDSIEAQVEFKRGGGSKYLAKK